MTMDLLDDDGLMDIGAHGSRTDPRAVTDELRAKQEHIPERNKALGQWAERLGDGGSLRDVAPHSNDECHLCTARGRNVCQQCSRKACASHFWVMFGLCRSCASEEGVKAWHKEKKAEDTNWLGDA